MAQMVLTIEYLKTLNIAHRDIKPGNIMIDENFNIKLIDFGEAKVIDEDLDDRTSTYSKISIYKPVTDGGSNGISGSSAGGESYFTKFLMGGVGKKNEKKQKNRGTFVGTPYYCAPEMLEDEVSGMFTDLWALGVIMFEMAVGRKMFKANNNLEIFNKIIKHEIFYPESLNEDTKDLI